MRKMILTYFLLIFSVHLCLASKGSVKWVNISGDLPNLRINSIAPHPFFSDSLFVGTLAGAFQASDGGNHWKKIKFSENADVPITQIRAEMHPFLDWTVPVLWIGTEEYTDIPEDRLGRIFFSENGGLEWINTYFPRIAVSALYVPRDSSLVAFAAAFNPFYYFDSFYAMDDTGWVEFDLTPGDTTVVQIKCIEIDDKNPNRIFLATSNGIYATKDWGLNWKQSGSYYDSPCIVLSKNEPDYAYAILFTGTRSEGIYRTKDYGENWERVCWTVNAVALIADYSTPGVWYNGIENLGIFKSTDNCTTWTPIGDGLQDKDILCLAQDRRNPKILYTGTDEGIFRYEEEATSVLFSDDKGKKNNPGTFSLPIAYPNPFNAIIQFCYQVDMEIAKVNIQIYNIQGRSIKVLLDANQSNGEYIIRWDGRDKYGKELPSGLYFCKIQFDNRIEKNLKLLLLR